jgi:hypothetical protein
VVIGSPKASHPSKDVLARILFADFACLGQVPMRVGA